MIKTRTIFLVFIPLLLFAISQCGPTIDSVPVVQNNGEIHVYGENFGDTQGQGYLSFSHEETVQEVHDVIEWSDNEIIANIPPDMSSCYIRVISETGFSQPKYFLVMKPDLPSQPYDYDTPVQEGSPWPVFRRDSKNNARSPIAANYNGDSPWLYKTGKGIFSTPIIDADGTIYVGSADHLFYALNTDGTVKWSIRTGELIDSAGAISRLDEEKGYAPLTFLSGDGNMYHVRTDEGIEDPKDRILWTFQATVAPAPGFNNWWEGNVVLGFDGTIYAGNTNFNYYAVNPDGTLQWTYTTGSNAWSATAFAEDGTIYWGSCDTMVHAVNPDGTPKWTYTTLGFVTASAAIGSDGTVYIGSFDSYMYALNPEDGSVIWEYPTGEHIYSSCALAEDENGNTTALYFGSADGKFYALSTQGELLWSYDTGDVIRSSPVLGRKPDGEEGYILYGGCGNGKVYALNAENGSRRWSFDTNPDDPELRDRNDLNGSAALGKTGVYIAGEHGYVCYIPYDYCLYNEDDRCETDSGEEFQDNITHLYYVTPGGNLRENDPTTLPVSTLITKRVVVRENGESINASVCNNPIYCPSDYLEIEVDPAFPYHMEPSADGRYIHIIPDGFLTPGEDYTISIKGLYYTGGWKIGNLTIGGSESGSFEDEMNFTVQTSNAAKVPLFVSENEVTSFVWTRLAAPIPPMLPSLNQIGFDTLYFVLGTIMITEPDENNEGKFILWAQGALPNEEGIVDIYPESNNVFPLSGQYKNDYFILTNKSFDLPINEVNVPFDLFQLRGQLGEDLIVQPGSTAYAEAEVLDIPNFGFYMAMAGLANNWWEKLLAVGTYITRPLNSSLTCNERPQGISVSTLAFTGNSITVDYQIESGQNFKLTEHTAAVLLIDKQKTEAVYFDYYNNTTNTIDADGNLKQTVLNIPSEVELPEEITVVVILDVFPFYEKRIAR